MTQVVSKEEFLTKVGTESAPSDWFKIDQDRINKFADATEDHQFIHVDPEQAAKTPFGGTIAHGFLSLSLLAHLNPGSGFVPENMQMGVNYGLNKVRFLNPVKVDSEVRVRTKVLDIQEKSPGQFLTTAEVTMDIKGSDKPALIAEWLTLLVTRP